MTRRNTLQIPYVDIQRAFIDHFVNDKEMRAVVKDSGYSTGVMQRAFKSHHRTLSQWAKLRSMPRVVFSGEVRAPTNFTYSALDEYGRIVASGNRQNSMFRYVLEAVKRMGFEPQWYIAGNYNT